MSFRTRCGEQRFYCEYAYDDDGIILMAKRGLVASPRRVPELGFQVDSCWHQVERGTFLGDSAVTALYINKTKRNRNSQQEDREETQAVEPERKRKSEYEAKQWVSKEPRA